ncbi:polyadenylate-binding protein 2-like [Panonychus citri]|uniref:polyadenylate-binding protein 2-like n=1 Tax=Panonychus citri TaxID=50023 RepID=UPI0023082317|nr:polyadenylate-binding protein 2-like [Panonychus citri]
MSESKQKLSDLVNKENGDGQLGSFNETSNEMLMDGEHNSTMSQQSNDNPDDPDLEEIKARVREMEEEAEKLKQMQDEAEKQMNLSSSSTAGLSPEEKREVDARSIYVGNVDYSATADDLERHFHGCGSINRVTILCDKFSGHPKGFAYIEFAEKDSVQTAMALDDSLFKGRQIKVNQKRTNTPGLSVTARPARGGMRASRRGFAGRAASWGFRPARRPRRGWYYSPY